VTTSFLGAFQTRAIQTYRKACAPTAMMKPSRQTASDGLRDPAKVDDALFRPEVRRALRVIVAQG
jgi:hypothetical protein